MGPLIELSSARRDLGFLSPGVRLNPLKIPPNDPGHAIESAPFTGLEKRWRGRHRRRPFIIGSILLVAVWTFCFGVVLVHLDQLSDFAPTVGYDRGTASTTQSGRAAHLDPRAAVLSTHELPGYKLINSAKAARPGGGTDSHSWDNLFQKSQAGAPDYRMTEAVVVVYGSAPDATAGVDQLRQAEESQGSKASPGLVASQSTTWVEAVGVQGYALVRVVFRMDNVVAQVALLGQDNPMLADEAQNLAGAQQARLLSLLQESS